MEEPVPVKKHLEALMLEGLKTVLTVPDVDHHEAQQILAKVLTEVEERTWEILDSVRKNCRSLEEMDEGVDKTMAMLGGMYSRIFEGLAIKGVYHAPTFGYTFENAPLEDIPPLHFFSMQAEAWFSVLRRITVVDLVLTNRMFQARQYTNMTQLDWFQHKDLKEIYKQTEKMDIVQTLGNLLNAAIVYTHCPKVGLLKILEAKGIQVDQQNPFLMEGTQLAIKSVLEPTDMKIWIESMVEGVAQVDANKVRSTNPKLFENHRYSHKISFLCSKLMRDLSALLTETHLVYILHECRAAELFSNPKTSTILECQLSHMVSKVVGLSAQVVGKIGDLFAAEEFEKFQKERAREMEELEGHTDNQQVEIQSTHLGKYTMLSMCLCPMISTLLKISIIRGDSKIHEPEEATSATLPGPTFLDHFVKGVVKGCHKWPTTELHAQIWMIADERNFGMDFWAQIYALVDERVSWTIFDTNQKESLKKLGSDLIPLHMLYLGISNLIHLTNAEEVDFIADLAKIISAKVDCEDLTFQS